MAAWICAQVLLANIKDSALDISMAAVLPMFSIALVFLESHVSARGQSIISHHNGFVEAHGSVIVISEEPTNENQIHLFGHAQKILRSKI